MRSSRCSARSVPETIRQSVGLPPLADALRAVHRPSSADEAERGRRRLAFDELLDLQLMLIRARAVAKRQRIGVAFEVKRDLTTKLRAESALGAHRRPAARAHARSPAT